MNNIIFLTCLPVSCLHMKGGGGATFHLILGSFHLYPLGGLSLLHDPPTPPPPPYEIFLFTMYSHYHSRYCKVFVIYIVIFKEKPLFYILKLEGNYFKNVIFLIYISIQKYPHTIKIFNVFSRNLSSTALILKI